MKFALTWIFITGALIFSVSSCSYENLEEIHPAFVCDTTGSITYDGEIKDILQKSCGSQDIACHKTGNTQDVNLDNYAETNDAAVNGDIMGTILHETGYEPMPSGGAKLDECTIDKFRAWINRNEPQ